MAGLKRTSVKETHMNEVTLEALGSSEEVIAAASEGRLTKTALAGLLTVDARRRFLDACAVIEKRYTDACGAANDPCLESGCAVEGEDEICLQPLLRADVEYQKACAAEWAGLFADAANRIEPWKR
jgi:hypothetical protein